MLATNTYSRIIYFQILWKSGISFYMYLWELLYVTESNHSWNLIRISENHFIFLNKPSLMWIIFRFGASSDFYLSCTTATNNQFCAVLLQKTLIFFRHEKKPTCYLKSGGKVDVYSDSRKYLKWGLEMLLKQINTILVNSK